MARTYRVIIVLFGGGVSFKFPVKANTAKDALRLARQRALRGALIRVSGTTK